MAPVSAELAAQLPDDWEVPSPPQVPEVWLPVWRAWRRLSADRPMHGGGLGPPVPGRIPWRDIDRWCARHGGDVAEYSEIFDSMDEVYVRWRIDQLKLHTQR